MRGGRTANTKTCYESLSQKGTYTIAGGTGAYKGITGSGMFTLSIREVEPVLLHSARALQPDLPPLEELGLTRRQSEVLALATQGLSAQQIADTLIVSRRTVEKHIEAIYTHLGVNTRAQAIAAVYARRPLASRLERAPRAASQTSTAPPA